MSYIFWPVSYKNLPMQWDDWVRNMDKLHLWLRLAQTITLYPQLQAYCKDATALISFQLISIAL